MEILQDGRVYIKAGERFPFKCPKCGTLITYQISIWVTCTSCGHEGRDDDFSDVAFILVKPN